MEEKHILVSVIMPCYNMEKYVGRAIESVMNQTASKDMYELVVIDDASTDFSLDIINEWKYKYPDNIFVLSLVENKRQGGARNEGIKAARGKYIAFLDSDDWIEPDTIDVFNNIIDRYSPDILYTNSIQSYCYEVGRVSAKYTIEQTNDIREIIQTDYGQFVNGVYKKSLILNNEVWFPEKLFYEDIYWGRMIKLFAKSVIRADIVTYHYFNNGESTVNRKNSEHHVERLTSYERLLEEYKRRGIIDEYYDIVLDDVIEVYFINSYYMFFTRMDTIPNVYERIRNNIFFYFPGWSVRYDANKYPMVYQYFLRYLEKAKNAKYEDLEAFKECILEVSSDE